MTVKASRMIVLGIALASVGISGMGCPLPLPALDPDAIQNDPRVIEALQEARNSGLVVTPQRGTSPPNIEGEYQLAGAVYVPRRAGLRPGTLTWSNQTADNHINTNYQQFLQAGANRTGEIVRGSGNRFTVYSMLRVTDESNGSQCVADVVLLFDGSKDSHGNISGVYVAVLLHEETSCGMFGTAGTLELTNDGSTSVRVYSSDDGQGFVGIQQANSSQDR